MQPQITAESRRRRRQVVPLLASLLALMPLASQQPAAIAQSLSCRADRFGGSEPTGVYIYELRDYGGNCDVSSATLLASRRSRAIIVRRQFGSSVRLVGGYRA